MESIILATMAVGFAKRAYEVASSLYQTIPKSTTQITIEITTSEGKTASKETITPTITRPLVLSLSSVLGTLAYHIHTIFLFTYSDAKTVVLPWTLFGLAHALSSSVLGLSASPSTLSVLIRTPQIMAWIYIHLVAFTIGNQRNPTAVLEDAINKPWRPIPAKRITPTQAYYLMICAHVVAFTFSLRFGGAAQSIALAVLGFAYNDLSLSSSSVVSRNLINGLGFISFGSGATEVAVGRGFAYSDALTVWLRIVALVVATGVQAADMYDQEGDVGVGRKTLPLVIGDEAARWTIALGVLAWSVACPYFWGLSVAGYVIPLLGGAVVARRTLTKKSVLQDKKTYKIWNLWLVAIYCLPLVKTVMS